VFFWGKLFHLFSLNKSQYKKSKLWMRDHVYIKRTWTTRFRGKATGSLAVASWINRRTLTVFGRVGWRHFERYPSLSAHLPPHHIPRRHFHCLLSQLSFLVCFPRYFFNYSSIITIFQGLISSTQLIFQFFIDIYIFLNEYMI
jgi:hypothetical protein